MDPISSCRECEAIVLEYRTAFYDFWRNSSPETRRLCQSVAKLIGGTEDDVVHLEGLAPPFRPLSAEQLTLDYRQVEGSYLGTSQSDRIRKVVGRKIQHQTATGHYIKLAIREGPGEAGGTPGNNNA
jgi:hypothetical protein